MPSVLRLSRVALLLLVGVLLTACQVDTVLEVAVNDDGSGTVTVEVGLDAEAYERIPNLAEQLRTEDLEEAGWTVTGPDTEDGITWFRASKPFADPAEGVSVVQEVAGPDGVLKQVELSRTKAIGATDYEFSAVADFADGLESFSDDQITELLGDPFGGNVAAIEQGTGVPATGQMTFTVRTDLPGSAPQTFSLDPTDVERQPVTATSTDPNWPARLLALAAVILLLGAVTTAIVVGARSRRRRRAAGRAAAIADAAEAADVEVAPAPERPGRRLEVVVLDGRGVVFESGGEVVPMLTEFAHDHGSVVSAARVEDVYRDATLGRLDDAQLWDVLGVDGDPDELTDTFLVGHRITPGLRPFLERVAERDLRVVVVANEVEAFAGKLRRAHKLGDLTGDWVISSDVGARLPDPIVFETCLRITEAPASNCFFIGSDPEMLESARAVGLAAAWFRPGGEADEVDEEEAPFPVIRSFEDLGIGS